MVLEHGIAPMRVSVVCGCLSIVWSVLFTGCATLVGAALDPSGTANKVASDTVNSVTQTNANQMANDSASDLDRIIAEHPSADNADELKGLRNELAHMPGANFRKDDDPYYEYRAQHDRRLMSKERATKDNPVVNPLPSKDSIPTGLRDTVTKNPHAVDAPPDEGPAYLLDTQQFRFGR